LLPGDVAADPNWRFAPIAVTNNAQRLAIIDSQATRFGKHCGEPVLRWKAELGGRFKNVDPAFTKDLYEGEPAL